MRNFLKNNMKNFSNKIVILVLISSMPVITFAADKDLKYIAGLIIDYLNIALYLIIGLAFVTFVWNVFRYFFTEKDKKEAGLYVMYSVIGFFLILSFWGIVAIVRNSLKLDDNPPSLVPDGLNFRQYISGSSGTNLPGVSNQGSNLPGVSNPRP